MAGEAAATIPGWFSVLPPLLAIGAALCFRAVVPSLFLGLWLGAWGVAGLTATGLGQGLLDSVGVYVVGALADEDHAAVILFSFMIGGLIGVITASGGMHGVVTWLLGRARTRRGGQLATILMGMAVFIDDYANSLIVGRTMSPVARKLGISREKMAYLVDSTAAPVAGVALITTWIGYQLGLLGDTLAHLPQLDTSPYGLFLGALPYSFYPWFALFLVFWVAGSGRDIGPMVAAEREAARVHATEPSEAETEASTAPVAYATVPLAVLIGGVFAGLWATGEGDSLRDIIGSASAYSALLWASLAAVVTAIVLPLMSGHCRLNTLMDGWTEGVGAMLPAMIILVLAWALAATTRELGTADYLVGLLEGSMTPALIPAVVFLLAAGTAFATGTSWGTMGILMPLVLPLAVALAPESMPILHASIAAVMAGAIFGDHCSPISDTTILSSMATGCDHVRHVQTQLPYALLAGGVALVAGWLPVGLGLPWWLCLPLGALLLMAAMQVFGRRATAEQLS